MQLREYQIRGIDAVSTKYQQGIRKLIFQLATGGGKTVTFAALIHTYLQTVKRKVLITVHREELLLQAKKTLFNWYGINAETVTSGIKYINPKADVYIAMVETANNRLAKNPSFFGDVGLLIIDEAHLGNFKKMHPFFEDERTLIVGFTATPISASKKHPLKDQYQDIICSIDIPELIKIGSLCPNRTYVATSVNRKRLKVKNGEFDNAQMGAEYSKTKHIDNCVRAYEEKAPGTKAIVFNCNAEHSKLVCQAFINKGYQARHLDDKVGKNERKEILRWFAETPGAILCNIAILIAGFDEPSIETVVVNLSTEALTKWLQMTGRGGRPFMGKDIFTIIDMGGNAITHGDWSTSRDWDYMFRYPEKPGKGGGVAPVRECAECQALISASASYCAYCGCVQPLPEVTYDRDEVEFELLETTISVNNIMQQAQMNNYNGYAALHQVKFLVVTKAREQSGEMDATRAYSLLEVFQHKVAEWCKMNGKNYDQWHKEMTAMWFFEEVKRVFHWERQQLYIAL